MIPMRILRRSWQVAELKIHWLPYREAYERVKDLLPGHYDELTQNKNVMKLAPDHARYEAMEEAEVFFTLVASLGDEVVGYSANFLTTHLHYKDCLVCSNDVLFLKQEHRRGRIGIRLIEATEQFAKECGAHLVMWHAKENTPLELLLRRRAKYKVQEIIFSKEV
jgi:GNAT superfamily N-acetyltransferase